MTTIDVVYSYEWRDAIPLNERNTPDHPSRPFCVKMMKLSAAGKRWTREEIAKLKNDMTDPYVKDVWTCRGGWSKPFCDEDEEPSTDNCLPYCRHIWVQQVVIT